MWYRLRYHVIPRGGMGHLSNNGVNLVATWAGAIVSVGIYLAQV